LKNVANNLTFPVNNKELSIFNLSVFSLSMGYTLVVGLFYWFLTDQPMVGIDDANIYMIYMRNLAEGHGFVYNIGGEHVEGFTSLLWTVFGSLLFLIFSAPEIALLGFSFLIVATIVLQLLNFINIYTRHKGLVSPYALLTLGLLAVIPGYFDWTLFTLMETGWWSLLLIALVFNIGLFFFDQTKKALQAKNKNFLFLLVLLLLTRPESLLWGLVFIGSRSLLFLLSSKSIKSATLDILKMVATYALTVSALTIWRIYYFGYPLPNTYYAKVSADIYTNIKDGGVYLFKFLLKGNPAVFIIIAIFIFWLVHFIRRGGYHSSRKLVLIWLGIVMMINLVLPLYTGGDHFVLFRFYQPLIPVIYVLFSLILFETFKETAPSSVFPILGVIILTASLLPTNRLYGYIPKLFIFHNHQTSGSSLYNEYHLANSGRIFGARLSHFFSESNHYPRYGLFAAGGMAYNYKGIAIDLLGLNNVIMAHAKKVKNSNSLKNHASFNKAVFYQLQPELMHLWTSFVEDKNTFVPTELSPTADEHFEAKIFSKIHKDRTFQKLYRPVYITQKSTGEILHTYIHKDFLSSLPKEKYDIEFVKLPQSETWQKK